MNREILFRGKRKDNGMWEYGNLSMRDEMGRRKYYIGQNMLGYEVLPETIGQYTGLTDKNGVKIFEGDIVQNIITKETAIVRWYTEYSAFMLYDKNNNKVYFLYDNDFNKIEIIDNIHDNPELVRKDEKNESSYKSD